MVRWEREDPQGGRDVVEILHYDVVDGLVVPHEIRFSNPQQKWKAQLTFSDWAVNDTQMTHLFDSSPQ